MKKVELFLADDGSVFYSEEECRQHEFTASEDGADCCIMYDCDGIKTDQCGSAMAIYIKDECIDVDRTKGAVWFKDHDTNEGPGICYEDSGVFMFDEYSGRYNYVPRDCCRALMNVFEDNPEVLR